MRRIVLWAGAGVGALALFMALLVVGVYGAAAGLLGGSGGGRGSGQLARNAVPAEYAALVQEWGNLCPTLSPALLAAQLNQESGFRTDRTSPANAQGIAQFIPSTWATHGLDANDDGVADVWDPEDAIPSAASYDCSLAGYVEDVPGDPVDNMLAAYNAGPYAVIQYNGVPPYTETQNYVRIIRDAEASFAAPVEEAGGGGGLPPLEQAAGAVNFAQEHLGTPYLWGGNGTPEHDGRFDCSGLTKAAYESVGIELPRVANDQWNAGPHPDRSELLPGDLVFFAYDLQDPRSIHHVGIYVGGGYMINAPYTGATIRFDPIDSQDYFGATRPTAG
ncbi:NlpC/P60 family protein [Streptomyces sp. NPDC127098]|uniref:C40 family peptidase n=1 Tax=Streptomyces sp. NPDC127098 TaxID=3347137 RepID=UPI00364A5F51